jgi:hypothetical protein
LEDEAAALRDGDGKTTAGTEEVVAGALAEGTGITAAAATEARS